MNRQREEERCILSYSSIPLALQSKGPPPHAGRHMPPRRRIARCQKHQPVPPSSGHCRSICSHRPLRSCEGKRPSDAVLRGMSYNAAGSTRERSGAESHRCRELGGLLKANVHAQDGARMGLLACKIGSLLRDSPIVGGCLVSPI
jgi:hypothetical protein